MLQECKGILKQVASNGEVDNLWTTISCVQLKKFKFWRAPFGWNFLYLPILKNFMCPSISGKKVKILEAMLGGNPHFGSPKFCQILSFLYIYLP